MIETSAFIFQGAGRLQVRLDGKNGHLKVLLARGPRDTSASRARNSGSAISGAACVNRSRCESEKSSIVQLLPEYAKTAGSKGAPSGSSRSRSDVAAASSLSTASVFSSVASPPSASFLTKRSA